MKSLRLLVGDVAVHDGDPVPVPRIGDGVRRGDEVVPIEAVTWDFRADDTVEVTLVVGARSYTY